MKHKTLTKALLGVAVCFVLLIVYSVGSLVASAVTIYNDIPTVTLEKSGDGVMFTFNRDTDLFDNFKGVMPGDTLVQKVKVRNTATGIADGNTFSIYMYAREKASEESQNNLLEEIEITVSKNGVVLDVMNAGANDKGVNLGSFKTGDEVELEVALNIPITLGNDFQDNTSTIEWYFVADQNVEIGENNIPVINIGDDNIPVINIGENSIPISDMPKTGLNNSILLSCIIFSVSLAGLLTIMIIRKKANRKS